MKAEIETENRERPDEQITTDTLDEKQTISEITGRERARAAEHLKQTRDELIGVAQGLSAAEWNHKPDAETWSAGETMEHVVLVERRMLALITTIDEGEEPPADWDRAAVDEQVCARVRDRSVKFAAPPIVQPTGHWERDFALQQFAEAREQTIQLLSTPRLRAHTKPHPVAGAWDGYHWLLAVGAHAARHADQIRELQASSGFQSLR